MTIQKSLAQQAQLKYKEYLEKVPELRRRRLERYTMLFLTFGALIIFILFAINPTVATIINLRKQLKDSRFVKTQIDEKLTALTSLETQYAAITNDLPAVFLAIPRTPDAPYFFAELQALAAQNQVKVVSLQADSAPLTYESTQVKPMQLPFSITVAGTYPNVMSFLTNVATNNRIISPSDITVTKSEEGGKTVELAIKAQVYFKP